MKKYILLLLSILLLFSGCTKTEGEIIDKDNSTKEELDKESDNEYLTEEKLLELELWGKISGMTLEEKIGQMFIAGFYGDKINNEIKDLVIKSNIGGLIFYKYNIKNGYQLLKLMNDIKSLNESENNIPLFMTIDQEGGRVNRLPKNIIKYPTARSIGNKNDEDLCFDIGKSTGFALNQFGFNLNFAPVLDVVTNPKNKAIGDRAFGTTADIVSRLGVATIKGLHSENVIACIKHFPGHGDVIEDSHGYLPVVNKNLDELMKLELIPFLNAMDNGAESIMMAHILMSKLDNTYPASISKTIVTDIIRDKFNYEGVIITDQLNMRAITKDYDMPTAIEKAINAGVDVLMIFLDNKYDFINIVKNKVGEGKISEDRINESVYRILKLKHKYNVNNDINKTVDINVINDTIKKLKNVVNSK